MIQPYRDLLRLLRKEVVLAESASWLFRVAPYLIFAATWVAAALVPTFAIGLAFNWAVDLIAIVALLGLRPVHAGAGRHGRRHQLRRDRQLARAHDREPGRAGDAAGRVHLALFAGTTRLSAIAEFVLTHPVGLRVSLA